MNNSGTKMTAGEKLVTICSASVLVLASGCVTPQHVQEETAKKANMLIYTQNTQRAERLS
jgi:hypothetical protein